MVGCTKIIRLVSPSSRATGNRSIDAPLVRIAVPPSPGNGLCKGSQLMADKLFSVPAAAIVSMVGRLEASAMAELDLALRG